MEGNNVTRKKLSKKLFFYITIVALVCLVTVFNLLNQNKLISKADGEPVLFSENGIDYHYSDRMTDKDVDISYDSSGNAWYILFDTDSDTKGDVLVIYGKGKVTNSTYPNYNSIPSKYHYTVYQEIKKVYSYSTDSSDPIKYDSASSLCNGLCNAEYIDLSNIDFSESTSMNCMFFGCEKLKEIKFNENIDTSKVTDMYEMFRDCFSLEEIDMSNFNTEKVTTMEKMFCACINLKSVNLKNLDAKKVTDMSCMFNACERLEEIDLSGFETSTELKMLGSMFACCVSLESINFGNEFDTSGCSWFGGFFYDCCNLEDITFGDKFSTESATSFEWAFYNCQKLKNVNMFDLSNVSTSTYYGISGIFCGCSQIEELDLSDLDITNDLVTFYYTDYNDDDIYPVYETINPFQLQDGDLVYDGIANRCDKLTVIHLGNDILSWGKGKDNSTGYGYNIAVEKLFYVELPDSGELLKTNIIVPDDKTDALLTLIESYDWASDNREITIYTETEWEEYKRLEEQKRQEELNKKNNSDSSSGNAKKKETTITVSTGSGSSSTILEKSNGYIKGYTEGIINTTKVFKPNEYMKRSELATIFTRIDVNYNENKDYKLNNSKYSDVYEDNWFSNDTGFVTERNIMKGYENGEFKPNNNITRGEFSKAICNYKNINLTVALSYNGELNDIEGKWYENYVKALNKLGYINGYEDGSFRGDDPITRAEIVTVLNRVLNVDKTKQKENIYSDISETDWFYKDVLASSME